MATDPGDMLATERMGPAQIVAVVLCVLLNALDGFDVLSISFASPGIAHEWGIERGALGVVLSMELIGMAIGSLALGRAADRFGRRPIIIACLIVMASGMFLAARATSVETLLAYRFVTGLGIGGMLACVNAMVAEYANNRYRSFAVMIMAAGYPLGAIVGGAVSSRLLATFDWRAVFILGGVATAALLPLVLLLLPESVAYLAVRRPPNALNRINAVLKRLGHRVIDALPAAQEKTGKGGFASLFSPTLVKTTILLTIAYFTHIMTFYFIIKWIPKLVVDMGHAPPEAGNVLVWANVGGATGAIMFGVLTRRIDVRWLVIAALAGSFALVALFGRGQADLVGLSLVSAIAGFFTNAAVVGLYALVAGYFPTEVRAGGTGFVIGLGRGGAALGPIAAGYLFQSGQGLQIVSLVMAAGSVVALVALLLLGKPRGVVAA
ncbi:MAG: MFS transporter [Hyphomonadaceae bacterium]|nr:MFS transporter [Hyphomonadaceae bacterium]